MGWGDCSARLPAEPTAAAVALRPDDHYLRTSRHVTHRPLCLAPVFSLQSPHLLDSQIRNSYELIS
jgi:hypothetical protein